MYVYVRSYCFFFFNDTATTEIYTLSLHDALPICGRVHGAGALRDGARRDAAPVRASHDHARSRARPAGWGKSPVLDGIKDRKSTRLNSSHANISYAVFCLKKKKNQYTLS